MNPGELADAQKMALRWFERMQNCVVDQGGVPPALSDIVKVVELVKKDGGVSEVGVWFNDERGSTHLRYWALVEEDLAR
jgi:hypothetical protein